MDDFGSPISDLIPKPPEYSGGFSAAPDENHFFAACRRGGWRWPMTSKASVVKRLHPALALEFLSILNRIVEWHESELLPDANQHEIHHELGPTPKTAKTQALEKNAPSCGPLHLLPLVALCLESAIPRPRRRRRQSPRRLPTPCHCRPATCHRHPLSSLRRRHLLPPTSSQSKDQTHRPPPLSRLLKLSTFARTQKSTFENYTTGQKSTLRSPFFRLK
jgi:hypothetical protein